MYTLLRVASVVLLVSLSFTPACPCIYRSLLARYPDSQLNSINNEKPEYDSRGLANFHHALRDQPSLIDRAASLGINANDLLPKQDDNDISKICRDNTYKAKVDDAITHVLNYYEGHIDILRLPDYIVGLAIMKGSKQGAKFEEIYPISKWMSEICKAYSDHETDINGCLDVTTNVTRNRNQPRRWQSARLLDAATQQFHFGEIGQEKELVWSDLNSECLKATLFRCEVPHVCERVFFDPKPRSQYMLAHQLVHRIFAEQPDCLKDTSNLVDPEVNLKLCAKMYMESQYISGLQRHLGLSYLQDLQSEYVAFCGYVGFPNFFRTDILDNLLEFQSKSEYGCFLDKDQERYVASHAPIMRRLTKAEEKSGMQIPKEFCDPHLSSLALSALVMFADYIEDGCTM